MEHLPGAFANHPFADVQRTPHSLGTGYQFGTSNEVAINPALALELVADMIRNDPEVAHSLARRVGYEKFVEPLDIAKPFPLSFHFSELSVSDRGPPKKGTKPSREPARYRATLKFAKVQARGIRDIWRADFDLRDHTRTSKKLADLCSPSKCRTPFTAPQREWAEQAIMIAEHGDFLIGFAYMKPRAHGGTHYVPDHALLVAPDFSEALMIACVDGVMLIVARCTVPVMPRPQLVPPAAAAAAAEAPWA